MTCAPPLEVRPPARQRPRAGPRRHARCQAALQRACFFPRERSDGQRVLAAEGCDARRPSGQGCCGALSLHSGRLEEAKRFARALIARLENASSLGRDRRQRRRLRLGALQSLRRIARPDDPGPGATAPFARDGRRRQRIPLATLEPRAPRAPLDLRDRLSRRLSSLPTRARDARATARAARRRYPGVDAAARSPNGRPVLAEARGPTICSSRRRRARSANGRSTAILTVAARTWSRARIRAARSRSDRSRAARARGTDVTYRIAIEILDTPRLMGRALNVRRERSCSRVRGADRGRRDVEAGMASDAGAPVPVPVTVKVHAAVGRSGDDGAEFAITMIVTELGPRRFPTRLRRGRRRPATQLLAIAVS